jgi:hypothetical protein
MGCDRPTRKSLHLDQAGARERAIRHAGKAVKPKKDGEGISSETAQMLRDIANQLDDHSKGKDLERHQAAAGRDVIRRILSPPAPKFTDAQSREIRVALDYAIRRELLPPGANRKALLAEIAKAHGGRTDKSVDHLKSEWKKYTEAWLARLDSNVEYAGLTRREMLERELSRLNES